MFGKKEKYQILKVGNKYAVRHVRKYSSHYVDKDNPFSYQSWTTEANMNSYCLMETIEEARNLIKSVIITVVEEVVEECTP